MITRGELRFYHRPDDPWSHLLLQLLPRLMQTYRVGLECITVPFPDVVHAPRPQLLARHALRDARDLAAYYQVEFASNGELPAAAAVALADRALLVPATSEAYLRLAYRLGAALFSGDSASLQSLCSSGDLPTEPAATARLQANHARLLDAAYAGMTG